MRESWSLARRELAGFFHSAIAYIFLAAFLAVSLFVVFWVDGFFAHDLANVRPLFQWMPIILIFLVAAITMRMWSEERSSGTLESLLTTPLSIAQLVFGKYLACLILVAIALALTLGLPITVSQIGPLDWGPVIGGYVAALFLASTYIAVGLFISALTENQIVSLIGTVVIGVILYLPGSPLLDGFFSTSAAHWMSLLGTGARFDSISRGVLDVRDLYYYVSLALVFLVLNGLALAALRRGKGRAPAAGPQPARHRIWAWVAALVIVNVLVANVWLAPLTGARVDLTQGKIYTLSPATDNELANLSEPLLLEGVFSRKTQPLLAPLVPQLKNLMREYGIDGGRRVEVKFVDPQKNQQAAREIAERYGIKPAPFRNQSRYEASVVNAYFDVLVKYGDQYKVLPFRKLISVAQGVNGRIKVNLKAPEYAITSAIKSVVGEYQTSGNIFASLGAPVTLHAYVSPSADLPGTLVKLDQDLRETTTAMQQKSGGKFHVDIKNPSANGGALAKKISKLYGFQPMVAGLLHPQPFFFYLLLQRGSQAVPVALPQDLSSSGLKQAIDTGLEQFATGARKTVAVYTPPRPRMRGPMRRRLGGNEATRYTQLIQVLRQHVVVKHASLKDGRVPAGSQLLLVLAPSSLGNKQLFAIDQFLMTGGTVVIAASPYQVSIGRMGLNAHPQATGLAQWLAAKGIRLKKSLVLDQQNTTFPVPVYRHVGGLVLREYYPMPYPYFPYISGAGLNPESPVTRGLRQVTLSWASPIELDHKKLANDKVTRLLTSSRDSWLSSSPDITPQRGMGGQPATWQPQGKLAPQLLGVAVQGRFTSWFADHKNPMLASNQTGAGNEDPVTDDPGKNDPSKADPSNDGATKGGNKADTKPVISQVIDHSPAASRLVVLGSASFASDGTMGMIGAGLGHDYDQPIRLVQNLLDWSLESPAMLALRDRSETPRLLAPLSHGQETFWEYLNYGLALLGLIIAGLIAWFLRRRRRAQLAGWLKGAGA